MDEVERLLGEDTDSEVAINESDVETLCQPGDMWHSRPHRVLCADSTDPDSVARLMKGAHCNLMVTDPPYGVEYEPEWRNEWRNAKPSERIAKVTGDDTWDYTSVIESFKGNVVYVWHSHSLSGYAHQMLVNAGYEVRTQIIWVKPSLVIGRGHYHTQHESCFYAVRKGQSANWTGSRTASTVWEAGLDLNDKTIHSTQKPIDCHVPANQASYAEGR